MKRIREMWMLGVLLCGCDPQTDLSRVQIPSRDLVDSVAIEADTTSASLATATEDTDTTPPVDTAAAALDSTAADPVSADSGWTAGVTEAPGSATRPATLSAVRAARNAGWDRVVWEFAGDSLPGYHAEYVSRPVRQCGSGRPVEIAGDAWLEVRFAPAQAHTEQGEPTLSAGDRARMMGLPVLQELRLTCDFEGNVTWMLGVAAPSRYRVLELRDPARVAVDVRR